MGRNMSDSESGDHTSVFLRQPLARLIRVSETGKRQVENTRKTNKEAASNDA